MERKKWWGAHTYVCVVMLYVTSLNAQLSGTSYNAALNKTTSQSSTAAGAVSSRAVDGCVGPHWGSNCCTHTEYTDITWLTVDLGEPLYLHSVTLHNRNAALDRLKGFTIYGSLISNDPTAANDAIECYHSDERVEGIKEFNCHTRFLTRYVTIYKDGSLSDHSDKALTICELEVKACAEEGCDVCTSARNCVTC